MGYNLAMRIETTSGFDEWLRSLKDSKGKTRIVARIRQCGLAGRPVGDINTVGEGVSELRIHYGPGYRVYFAQKGDILMLLLAGGSKRSQQSDIERARSILNELKETRQW